MATYKVTFFFESNTAGGSQGWSESYYKDATSHTSLANLVGPLRYARRRIMSAQWRLRYTRISDVDRLRDSLLVAHGPGDSEGLLGTGTAGLDPTPRAQYYDALYLRASTGGFSHWRPIHLRGIGSDSITPSGVPDFTSATLQRLPEFTSELISGSYKIKINTPGSVIAPPPNVIEVSGAGKALQLTGTYTGLGFAPGDQILIRKATGGYPVNGFWRLISVTNTVMLTYPKRRQVDLPPGIPVWCEIVKYEPFYQTINDIVTVRGTLKKTGRPFGSARGKRSPIKT